MRVFLAGAVGLFPESSVLHHLVDEQLCSLYIPAAMRNHIRYLPHFAAGSAVISYYLPASFAVLLEKVCRFPRILLILHRE